MMMITITRYTVTGVIMNHVSIHSRSKESVPNGSSYMTCVLNREAHSNNMLALQAPFSRHDEFDDSL